jgi:hypothetical protein
MKTLLKIIYTILALAPIFALGYMAGIKVLRCSQNGKGILVTVSKSDLVKAISFFNEYSLTRANGLPVSRSISVGSNYADFGTVFRTEK